VLASVAKLLTEKEVLSRDDLTALMGVTASRGPVTGSPTEENEI
jgi:hypothetical protein